MKPITEGCLAIIVRAELPQNLGKLVRVGKYLGNVEGCQLSHLWEVTPPVAWHTTIDTIVYEYYTVEDRLERIDDLSEKDCDAIKEKSLTVSQHGTHYAFQRGSKNGVPQSTFPIIS